MQQVWLYPDCIAALDYIAPMVQVPAPVESPFEPVLLLPVCCCAEAALQGMLRCLLRAPICRAR